MDMFKNLCRCCLSPNTDVSIFEEKSNIEEKFLETTTIQVSLNDGLPQRLCKNCFNLMNTAYHFKTQCIKMDFELKLQIKALDDKNVDNNIQDLPLDIENQSQNNENNTDINDHNNGEDNDDDFGSNPLKQLQSIIKSEPADSNENEDDFYFVVVVDDDDDIKTKENKVTIVKEEPVEPILQERFEDSLGSFISTRDKIPDSVPAAILQHEEEDYDEQNQFMEIDNIVNNNPETNDLEIPINIIENVIQQDDNSIQPLTINSQSGNEYIKIVTATDPDGNIILKAGDNITYVTEGNNEENHVDPEEILVYEEGEASPFQILSCDGELVIEYADESALNKDDNNIYPCSCGAEFDDYHTYETHLVEHMAANVCNLCGKGFETTEILNGHMVLHSVRGPNVNCPYCNHLIKRNSLTQHIKYSHNKMKTRCNVCSKNFANPNNLKRHMMIHSGVRQFECDLCLKRFHQKITLQTHRLTHVGPFACNQCDIAFTSKLGLDEHKSSESCTKSKLTRIKVELVKTLKQEIKSTDNELLGYGCSMCKKMFSLESALETHVEKTHMQNQLKFMCQDCGEMKSSNKELVSHMICHKNARNKNMKRFECPTCGKGCPSKAMLIMHERVHTDERPYQCSLCTSRFKTKTHLRTHQLTHTREKKFGCSICMKFFALKGNLVVHLRTHTGERPYVCHLCGDAFIDSKYLKKHKKKAHALDLPWNKY